jgi:hypothetical protein
MVTDCLPHSGIPLLSSGWRSQPLSTRRIAVTASFALQVTAAKPEISPPYPNSVISLPALGPSSRSNDRVRLGLAKISILVWFRGLPNRPRTYTSPFNSFLLARFPHPPLSGVLAHLFFHFLQLLEPAGIPISIRNHAIQHGFVNNIRRDRTLSVGVDAKYVLRPFFDPPLHGLNVRISDMQQLDMRVQST